MAGAAAATVFGQAVAGTLAILFNVKVNKDIQLDFRKFRPDKMMIGKIYAVGVPSIIMQAIGSVMTYGMNLIPVSYTHLRIADTHIYFLPGGKEEAALPPSFEIRWYEKDELADWKEGAAFRHAICGAELMPDMIAAAAVLDGKTVAVAGASEDSPLMWQIGIDVLPAFEGKGLAAGLVTLLKQEILRRGKIPFYGTSESHGVSRNVAVRSGFLPAWAEIYVQKKRKN